MLRALFREILYRPIFNLLIFIYSHMPIYKDMGIALIVFSLAIYLLLLPLKTRADRSKPDDKKIRDKLWKIKARFKNEPLLYAKARKELIKKHRAAVNPKALYISLELTCFLVLWWVFTNGLNRKEWYWLYRWVPRPVEPINITLMRLFELTSPYYLLAIVSAVELLATLLLAKWLKPQTATREDYLGIILGPLLIYYILKKLPAGQVIFFTVFQTIEVLTQIGKANRRLNKKLGYPEGESPFSLKQFWHSARDQVLGR